jgi:hypothetical protein
MAHHIQAAVWKRDVRRAKAAHAIFMQDQHNCCTLKNELTKCLSSDKPWRQLLLVANDNKRVHTYSGYD